ncbi:MAG: hypothetical protein RLZZ555_1223 [Pseudomonadota bacterium]|jgi:hypothetical protein
MSQDKQVISHRQQGWNSQDWDHVIEANEAMQDAADDLNHAVNGGGGAFGPERLRLIADKIESVASELRAICARYQ